MHATPTARLAAARRLLSTLDFGDTVGDNVRTEADRLAWTDRARAEQIIEGATLRRYLLVVGDDEHRLVELYDHPDTDSLSQAILSIGHDEDGFPVAERVIAVLDLDEDRTLDFSIRVVFS